MNVPRLLRYLLLALLLTVLPSLVTPAEPAETPEAAPATTAPADATTQDAPAPEDQLDADAPQDSMVVSLFKQGGATMYFLTALLILTVVISLERFVMVRRGNFAPVGLGEKASGLWQAGDFSGVQQLGTADGSILGNVIAFCGAHHGESYETIDQAAGDVAGRALQSHQQMAYWLAVVATLAPLLGLLGTVLGMISAFNSVALAGDIGNIKQVAGGISKALVTTAYGLIVAVPSLAAYHFFKIRVNSLAIKVEDACSEFIVSNCGKEG